MPAELPQALSLLALAVLISSVVTVGFGIARLFAKRWRLGIPAVVLGAVSILTLVSLIGSHASWDGNTAPQGAGNNVLWASVLTGTAALQVLVVLRPQRFAGPIGVVVSVAALAVIALLFGTR